MGADGATLGRGAAPHKQLAHYSNVSAWPQGSCPESAAVNRRLLTSMYLRAAAVTLAFCALCTLLVLSLVHVVKQQSPQTCLALLLVAAAAEVHFARLWLSKYHRLSRQPELHRPKHPSFDPRQAFDRFVQSANGQHITSKWICIKEMLTTWFGDVPIEDIKAGNVCDLITYGFWYMSRDEYESACGHPPELLVSELEEAWGIRFTPGHNAQLTFMAHLWQPIRCHYRPLAFYLIMECTFLLCWCVMHAMGFRSGTVAGFTYYTYGVHPSISAQLGRMPILFQHGVGAGLLPYALFVARMACLGHPVAAMECAHLSMRWTEVIDADQVVEALAELLEQRLCWARTCVSGHSYGTFYASRLLQLHPHLVDSLCLVDPVTFNMFTGKLIQNFVYKVPDLITWFIARDIHHAASVCRNFFWSCLCLWPDQLPPRTLVVLSEADDLVPVRETVAMLRHEAPQALVMHHPNHRHADFIVDLPWQDAVVSSLAELLDGPHSDWRAPEQRYVAKPQQRLYTAQEEKQQQNAHCLFNSDSDTSQKQQVGSDSSTHDGTYSPRPQPVTHRRSPYGSSRDHQRQQAQVQASAQVRPARRSSRLQETTPEASSAGHDAATPQYVARLRPKPHRVLTPQK